MINDYMVLFFIGIIVTIILIILSLFKDEKGIIKKVKFFLMLPIDLLFIFYLLKLLFGNISLKEFVFFEEYFLFGFIDSLLFFCNRKWAIVIIGFILLSIILFLLFAI